MEPTTDSTGDDPDRPLPPYYRRIKHGGSATVALGAAMIAVGEILEPEKTAVEIEQERDASGEPDDLTLEFGSLPSLED